MPRLEILEDRNVPSTWTVTTPADSGDGSLRAAITTAQSGDQIVFDQSLQGQTITLTSGQLALAKSLDIEGPGADQLAVSGNHASRVFAISGGVTVTVAGLTITDGLVVGDRGGGILNVGSTLTLPHDVLSDNEALGASGSDARGGAISNLSGAHLTVTGSLFTHNQVIGGPGGGSANGSGNGGAIHNNASTTSVTDSTFIANLARGGPGGGQAAGGGIVNSGGATAAVTNSGFIGNQAIAGDGGGVTASNPLVGFGRAGGIYNFQASLTVANCTFTGNRGIGGNGGSGASGASPFYTVGVGAAGGVDNADEATLILSASTFADNQAIGGSNATGGTDGNGFVGLAEGGGLWNIGVATVTGCTFDHNEALGGSGNTGGSGFILFGLGAGGGIYTSGENTSGSRAILTASNLRLRNNRAVGGTGNTAGPFVGAGLGGGLLSSGAGLLIPSGGSTTTISNSTVADNQALGGQGGTGGNGRDALGCGLANIFGAALTVSGSTLTDNQALGGAGGDGGNGGSGTGGGLVNDGPSTFPTNLGTPAILTVLGSTVTGTEAHGGAAGSGGNSAGLGAGGGISSAGILAVLGSSLAHNAALGHDGEGGASSLITALPTATMIASAVRARYLGAVRSP
jgi:hypothetical protein